MKNVRLNVHIVVGVLFLVFLTNYFLQHQEISTSFSRNYLDDLLAMPIIFYLVQMIMRWLYRDNKFILDSTMLLMGFVWVSITFEWLLPKYFEHLTADVWDVFCYALGTVFFYLFNRLGF